MPNLVSSSYYLPGESLPSLNLFSFFFFWYVRTYVYTYEHAVVEHLPQAHRSTTPYALHSTTSRSTRRSERDNASQHPELARASMSSSVCTARLCQYDRRHRNLPGLLVYIFFFQMEISYTRIRRSSRRLQVASLCTYHHPQTSRPHCICIFFFLLSE